jgi:hypothetical protein
MADRANFSVTYQPLKKTPNGYLIDYLKNKSQDTELKKTIFEILEIWAMPLALRQAEGVDLEAKSWASIQELIRQAWLIATTNDLDMDKFANLVIATLNIYEPGCTAAIAQPRTAATPPQEEERSSLDREISDEEIDELKGFS